MKISPEETLKILNSLFRFAGGQLKKHEDFIKEREKENLDFWKNLDYNTVEDFLSRKFYRGDTIEVKLVTYIREKSGYIKIEGT